MKTETKVEVVKVKDPLEEIKRLNKCIDKDAYNSPKLNVKLNQWGLTHYTNKTKKIWNKYFNK